MIIISLVVLLLIGIVIKEYISLPRKRKFTSYEITNIRFNNKKKIK